MFFKHHREDDLKAKLLQANTEKENQDKSVYEMQLKSVSDFYRYYFKNFKNFCYLKKRLL